MPTAVALPLTMLRPGSDARVKEIRTPGHGLRRRLASLGILPGTEIAVVQSDARGGLIIRVDEARLILGRGMAQRILVAPVND